MDLSALVDDTLNRLGEQQSSIIAAYMTAGTQTPVLTAAQVITGYLNDAQNDMARNYWAITDTATYSWTSGVPAVKFKNFTCASSASATLFAVHTVIWNAALMQYAEEGGDDTWILDRVVGNTGTPVYYYQDGLDTLCLHPIPSATHTVTVKGYVLPAPLSSDSDVPSWLPSDVHYLLSYYAAAMVLIRKKEDPILSTRGDVFLQLYNRTASMFTGRAMRTNLQSIADMSLPSQPVQTQQPQGPPQ